MTAHFYFLFINNKRLKSCYKTRKSSMFKKVFLILIIAVSFLSSKNSLALQDRIQVLSEHQSCAMDSECTLVETDCKRIDCEDGTPVHRVYFQEYYDKVQACRQGREKISSCDRYTPNLYAKCENNQCQLSSKRAEGTFIYDEILEIIIETTQDGKGIIAKDSNHTMKWTVNIIDRFGKPSIGSAIIRNILLVEDKVIVTFGKHDSAQIDINTGEATYLGSD